MTQPTSLRHWVDEAIRKLGYLRPEAAEKIVQMTKEHSEQHPKAIATAYRKSGKQISSDEKKRLGIRANAFMSEAALADLTARGLEAPLAAHEMTILRATLAQGRSSSLAAARELGATKWEWLPAFEKDCSGCARLKGQVFSADEVLPAGPPDCFREACAASYTPMMTYEELRPNVSEHRPRSWWKFW